MRLTPKLIGYLYRRLNRRAGVLPALSIAHVDTLTWSVADGILTTSVAGNPAAGLSLDLMQFTMQSLVDALNSTAGYTSSLAPGEQAALGAQTLMDAAGTGDAALSYYTVLEWAWMDTMAWLLTDARQAITDMLAELDLSTSSGEWLDYWMDKFGARRRRAAEADTAYRDSSLADLLALKSNNLGIEDIIERQFGVRVEIRDIPWSRIGGMLQTWGGIDWQPTMVTNGAAVCGPASDTVIDAGVIADFHLATLPGGAPAWGDPAQGNELVCAFAAIFPPGLATSLMREILAAINRIRLGGTIGIAYVYASPLRTNVATDVTNSNDHLSGPVTTLYQQAVL